MSIAQMRDTLKNAPKYNHTPQARTTWAARVDSMPDKQVMAIYFRMLKGGELK